MPPHTLQPVRQRRLFRSPTTPLALALATVMAACTSVQVPPPATLPGQTPPPVGQPAAPTLLELDQLPGFSSDPLDGVQSALAGQCARPPALWKRLCADLPGADVPAAALRDWLRRNFAARLLVDPDQPEGLVTGYYEPLIRGSLTRENARQVPLMAPPEDLVTVDLGDIAPQIRGLRLKGRVEGNRLVPYYTREQINRTRSTVGKPLLYVDDPVDAYFLEIQGSGRVLLHNGQEVRVGYADQNGHPYHAIGQTLIRRGALKREEVTAPAIRQWLKQNPDQAQRVLNTNPSKVFFRLLPPLDHPTLGPPGALNVPLTPMRSIAVDPKQIPLGSLVFLSTQHPASGTPWQRLMVAQDTGGAIRGVARADIFWGRGEGAGHEAGLMKAPGQFWMLVPRASRAGTVPSAGAARPPVPAGVEPETGAGTPARAAGSVITPAADPMESPAMDEPAARPFPIPPSAF